MYFKLNVTEAGGGVGLHICTCHLVLAICHLLLAIWCPFCSHFSTNICSNFVSGFEVVLFNDTWSQ